MSILDLLTGRHRARADFGLLDARALAKLLETEVMDRDDAAKFLGVSVTSVEMAAWRQRVPSVQYKRLRLFARQDLLDYRHRRGTGRASKLKPQPMYVVVGRTVVRVDAPTGGSHRGY